MAKRASGTVYPLSALREVVLQAQRLAAPPAVPTADTIVDLVKALGGDWCAPQAQGAQAACVSAAVSTRPGKTNATP